MMKSRTAFSSRLSFTLVEMLTSIAVLSLLMILIFSIVGSSLQISDSTTRSADSGIEGKQVLDRIGADIAGMLIRPDVDQFYYSGTGAGENDKMFFYSQQTGFFNSTSVTSIQAQSPVTFVGYRINTTDNTAGVPMMERLARGLIWDTSTDSLVSGKIDSSSTTAPFTYLTFGSRTSPITYPALVAGAITTVWGAGATHPDVGSGTYDNGTSPYYDAIGPQVFRFEVCFQIQNGANQIFSLYPGYTNSAPVYPASLTNNVAIVVAIATLDSKSRKLVPAASWNTLIAALPNPTPANLSANPPVLMDSLWNTQLHQSGFAATAGIPAVAASHIKVYQRYYYLNAPKSQ